MFKSCCARPHKNYNKNKTSNDNMDLCNLSKSQEETKESIIDAKPKSEQKETDCNVLQSVQTKAEELDIKNTPQKLSVSDTLHEEITDTLSDTKCKLDLMKKRYSVDYKKTRLDFKRYSVDCRQDAETLKELERLQIELARKNVEVRPGGRRKSSGILKSVTSSNEVSEARLPIKIETDCSDDDDVFENISAVEPEPTGPNDPPATPVGRDELALRRHRFFSDLVSAARAAVEHRVRFDPLGPLIAGGEAETTSSNQGPSADLEVLIERLERVTSRLERLPLLRARTPPLSPAPSPAPSPPPSPVSVRTLSPVAFEFEGDNMSVNGYQDLLQGPLRSYLELSQQIGGDVATHAKLVDAAFQAQLRYIQLATQRGKPSDAEAVTLLAPTSEQITAIQNFREKNRTSKFFNHLSAISESIPALGWVAVAPTPGPYVKEMNDAGQFYTNRVLKEWKEKSKCHVDWCKAWVQLLTELQAFVKQHHTTGLVWSGRGGGAPPPPACGLPPPPPQLPEADFSNLSVDDRSALFAQINQGEHITSSLRKVTSDMQTHKNPTLRSGPAPFKAAPSAAPSRALPTPGAGIVDKPPVFARDGKKWLIEYQKGNSNLVVENADMNNVVYMFRCRDSALTVRGKINGVVLDSCTKCAVVFDNLVSSIEFVNCQSVQMQVLGKVPTISIDKTDGCQIYLSKDSLDVEVVSSKSSEMNVLLPQANGDYTEHPIPEQFKTVLKNKVLSTVPVDSTG